MANVARIAIGQEDDSLVGYPSRTLLSYTKKEVNKMARVDEREDLELLCERASHGERVVFSHKGIKLALVPLTDFELLEDLEDKDDCVAARAAIQEMNESKEKPISYNEAFVS